MALNLHLLRLFAAVAAERSFSRAAARLHVSQPAVSRGVRELEAQIGTALLERGAGGLRLTDAGGILADTAQAVFAAEQAAEEDLAALKGLSRGRLAVGASTTAATWFLPPLLARFAAAHPAVTLRLHVGNTADIAARLLARELDIAIVEGPPADAPGLQIVRWRQDVMAVVAASGHRLAKGRHRPAALDDELLLVREAGSGTREVVQAALAAHGVAPRATLEVASTEMAVQLAAAGLGVTIVSREAAAAQLALRRLVALDLDGFAPQRPLSRLSLEGRQPSPAAVAFAGLLDAENQSGPGHAGPGKRRAPARA